MHEIALDRAPVIEPKSAERIAVFRYGDKVAAVSKVCGHQAEPLGEGLEIDGCINCPCHVYQYRPEDGCSPPPFTERSSTYRTRIVQGEIWVHPVPLPPGTAVAPLQVDGANA